MKRTIVILLFSILTISGCGQNVDEDVVIASEDKLDADDIKDDEEDTKNEADIEDEDDEDDSLSIEDDEDTSKDEESIDENEEDDDVEEDEESEVSCLEVISDEEIEDAPEIEEKLSQGIKNFTDAVEGDITDSIDGIEESDLQGSLTITRTIDSDQNVTYSLEYDGTEFASFTPGEYNSFEYIQVHDIDDDGSDEILLASYGANKVGYEASDFYIYKCTDDSWSVYASLWGNDNDTGIVQVLSGDYDLSRVRLDVSLVDEGIQLIVDAGDLEETEDGDMWVPDPRVVIIA